MRRLTRNGALILLPALMATAFAASAAALDGRPATAVSSGRTTQTTDAKDAPLQVYGERTWPLERGIAYWNDLAGRKVIRYAGRHMAPAVASDPHTVVVTFGALTGLSGRRCRPSGQTSQVITIDPRYMFQWVVYAHEFGHALGFHHDNGRGYDGVMSYASMWDDPSPKADKQLLSRQRDPN
jgi:hypothetical protein